MTWKEIESNASWANARGNGNAKRTARMLMNRCLVFMMYRVSLSPEIFRARCKKLEGLTISRGIERTIIAQDLSPVATPDLPAFMTLC
jgi:hypothetical protein